MAKTAARQQAEAREEIKRCDAEVADEVLDPHAPAEALYECRRKPAERLEFQRWLVSAP